MLDVFAAVERQMAHDVLAVDRRIGRIELFPVAADLNRRPPDRQPFTRLFGHEGHAIADFEDARDILGALDVSRHPVELICGTAQHVTLLVSRYPWYRHPATN